MSTTFLVWFLRHKERIARIGTGHVVYACFNWFYDQVLYVFIVYHLGLLVGGTLMTAGSLLQCAALLLAYQRMRIEWVGEPGTRAGVNGMLDYGYAVMRTAVLRSLAAHGLIAALGIHHKAKAGSFALADDLMEPLRPFIDGQLYHHLEHGGVVGDMKNWAPQAGALLVTEVTMGKNKLWLLNAIDRYVQSFQQASTSGTSHGLQFPPINSS